MLDCKLVEGSVPLPVETAVPEGYICVRIDAGCSGNDLKLTTGLTVSKNFSMNPFLPNCSESHGRSDWFIGVRYINFITNPFTTNNPN